MHTLGPLASRRRRMSQKRGENAEVRGGEQQSQASQFTNFPSTFHNYDQTRGEKISKTSQNDQKSKLLEPLKDEQISFPHILERQPRIWPRSYAESALHSILESLSYYLLFIHSFVYV